MLDRNDKQWLTELFNTRFAEQDARIDEKFDKRFAEQDARIDEKFDKQFAEHDANPEKRRQGMRDQYEIMVEVLDKRAQMLREETDARFAKMMEAVDRKFEEQNRYLGLAGDNKWPSPDTVTEDWVDAHKPYDLNNPYDRMEKRFDELERRLRTLK